MLLPHIPEKLLKRDKNQFGRYCTAFSSWRGALLSLSVYLSVCLSSLYQHLSFYLSFLSLAPWSRPNPLLFLLISPRVFFHFYFRLQFPSFYSTNFRFLLIFREFWRSWKDFFFFRFPDTQTETHVLSTANNSLVRTKHSKSKLWKLARITWRTLIVQNPAIG